MQTRSSGMCVSNHLGASKRYDRSVNESGQTRQLGFAESSTDFEQETNATRGIRRIPTDSTHRNTLNHREALANQTEIL